jgi:hypothetical protein
MIDSNETGSVLFRDDAMEGPQPQEASAVPTGHSEAPVASSFEPIEKGGGSTALWGALLALALALAALAGYDYWFLRKTGFSIATLPNLVQSVSALGNRLDAVEGQAKAWATERQTLLDEMSRTNQRVRSELGGIRVQTQHMMASAESRMERQLDQRTGPIDTRLDGVETRLQDDRARVAQLAAAVGTLRQRLAAVQQQQEQNLQRLRGLEREQGQTSSAVDSLTHQLQRKRVSFEAGKGVGNEIVPGISLHLTKTNVLHQRYSGWISDVHTHRTLWIKNQGVQQPVIFYSAGGQRALELIVTRVSKGAASGYLLIPQSAEGSATESETAPAGSGASSGS